MYESELGTTSTRADLLLGEARSGADTRASTTDTVLGHGNRVRPSRKSRCVSCTAVFDIAAATRRVTDRNLAAMGLFDRRKFKPFTSVTAAILGTAAIGAAIAIVFNVVTSTFRFVILLVFLSVALVQILWRALLRDSVPQATVIGSPVDIDQAVHNALEQALAVEVGVPASALFDFISRVAFPYNWRIRVSEVIDVDHDRVVKTVATNWLLIHTSENGWPNRTFIPIAQAPKGRLFLNPGISERDGTELIPLPFNHALGLGLAGLVVSYRSAYGLAPQLSAWDPVHRQAISRLVAIAIQPAHVLDDQTIARHRQYVEATFAASSNESVQDVDAQESCRRLAHILIDRYFIVGSLNSDASTFWIKHTFEVPYFAISRPPVKGDVWYPVRKLVQLLNQPYGFIRVDMARSSRAESYHFLMNLPPLSYSGDLALDRIENGVRVPVLRSTRARTLIDGNYIRMPVPGGSSVQLYARGLPPTVENLQLRFRAFEKPYLDALASFWALLVLIIIVALQKGNVTQGNGNDYIAVALAFPVVVATAISLYASFRRRSYATSLSALMVGILAFATGTVAVILYLVRLAFPAQWLLGFVSSELFWSALSVIALWLFLVISSIAMVRSIRYWALQRR